MAKGKKKEELRIEEKLEQALVPREEWPYEVPENWCWVRLGSIADWCSGGTPSRKKPKYYEGNIPWIKTGELNDYFLYDSEEKITEEAVMNSSAKILPEETVVIAMYGATIGKTGILKIPAATNQACACARCKKVMNNMYLFYYLRSQKDIFIEKGKGGAQPNISQEIIKQHHIPLPPLAEQQRIVNRIESLFSKLDEAKEKAQEALDSFEERKVAILHKAFSGELTEKWRAENGVSIDSWEVSEIGNAVKAVKDKYIPNAKENIFYKYIGLEHIEKGKGIISTGNSSDVKSTKTIFKKTDVLYGKLRPYLNKHDVADFDGICSTDILVYRTDCLSTSKFINYIFDTNDFIEYATNNSKGINLPRTSEKLVSAYKVSIPETKEQEEIVRLLDIFYEQEYYAQKKISELINDVDNIKKAILAKAFRGELGTNNMVEDSSIQLLAGIGRNIE